MHRKIPVVEATAKVYEALAPLDPAARQRVIDAAMTLLGNESAQKPAKVEQAGGPPRLATSSPLLVR